MRFLAPVAASRYRCPDSKWTRVATTGRGWARLLPRRWVGNPPCSTACHLQLDAHRQAACETHPRCVSTMGRCPIGCNTPRTLTSTEEGPERRQPESSAVLAPLQACSRCSSDSSTCSRLLHGNLKNHPQELVSLALGLLVNGLNARGAASRRRSQPQPRQKPSARSQRRASQPGKRRSSRARRAPTLSWP